MKHMSKIAKFQNMAFRKLLKNQAGGSLSKVPKKVSDKTKTIAEQIAEKAKKRNQQRIMKNKERIQGFLSQKRKDVDFPTI